MTRNEFIAYIEEHYSEKAEMPFAKHPSIVVFRHSSNKKWFAAIMTIPKNKLEPYADGTIDIVNVKCDPNVLYSMIQENGIYRAYHMNKNHWLTFTLDGTVDDETQKWLTDISFDLTSPKRKK
ncbi:MAG: MmcQ/YjbR family DNA-binding protein [Clostridia bacterium]|nr:MmcQ/YjbR family DNA-binding protein [Clostridia bacterium]